VQQTEKKTPTPGFEETYRDHRIALVRLAYLMCGSHHASEDVVQTAFTTAHARWEQIEAPVPYLKRAVVNLVKDGQRRRFRRVSVMGPETSLCVLPPEVDETWELIQRLPWTQRAVIVLHYYDDFSLAEVAGVLERAPSTVRSDHRRALDKLRKALS
jgi:DNA-directed RNA polymerase specialized sigma24 family protein